MGKRWLAALGGVLLVSVAVLSALWWVLRASLPLLDGVRVVAATTGATKVGVAVAAAVIATDGPEVCTQA